jgi:hypothetical protein
VFGVPRTASEVIQKTRIGDLLIFHLLRPKGGLVAVSRIVSNVYEDNSDIWGKDRFPLRVTLEFLSEIDCFEKNPIPLSNLYRFHSDEFTIEPWFHAVVMTPISPQQYENVSKYFFPDNV